MMRDEEPGETSSASPEVERQPAVIQRGRSCTGCLYHSSHRRQTGRNPLCVGFSRPDRQAYSAEADWEALRDGKKLLEFKYGCLGYSVYKPTSPGTTSSDASSSSHVELPVCLGIEFLLLDPGRASQEQQQQMLQKHPQEQQAQPEQQHVAHEEGVPFPRSPPPAISRTPSGADEFSKRFLRTSGLILGAVGANLSRIAGSIKTGIGDILFPDRRRPK